MYLIRRSDDDSLVKIKDTELAADLGNEGDLVPFYKAGTKYTGYIIFHYANRAELKEKLGQLQAELDASKERKAETPKAAPNLAPSKRKRKPKIIFTPASSKKISKIKPAKLNQATKVKRSNAEKVSTRKIDSSSSSRTESSTDEDKSDLENISQPEAKKLCFKPRHAESEILKEKKIEKTNLSELEDALDEGDLLNTPRKHVAQGQGLESMGRGSQVIRGTSINPSGKKTGSVSTRAPKNAVSEDEDDLFNTPGKRVAQGQGLESMGRGSQVIRGTSINPSGKKTGSVSTRAPKNAVSEDEDDLFNTPGKRVAQGQGLESMGRGSQVIRGTSINPSGKKTGSVSTRAPKNAVSEDEDDLFNTPGKRVAQGQGLESMGRGSQVIRGTSINPSGKKTGSVSTRAPKNAVSEDEDDLFNTPGKRVAQGQGLESMGRGSQVIRGTSINSSGKKTGFVSTRALEYAFSEDEAEIFDNTKNQDLRKDRPAPRMGRASPVYAHSEAKKRQMVPSSESEDIASDDESVRTERNNEVEISVDVTDDEDADDEKQLFGKNWDNGKMKKLKGGIYIKLSIWTRIKYHRNLTPNLLMRNMIEGIFNPEYILNRTFTGKKPTNKDQAIENVQPLHPKAIEVIFETIQQNAKKRGWPLPLDMKDLYRTATQRIGQLKRDYRNRNQGGNN